MAATAALAAQPAAAGRAAKCSTDDPYTLTAGALTGAQATDLALRFTAAPGCEPVTVVDQLRVKTFRPDDRLATARDLYGLAVQDGGLAVPLDRVARGRRIEVRATVRTGLPERTYVVRGDTTSLLRPDLVVASVHAPRQTLTTRPVDVVAEIAEQDGDTSATAEVSLVGAIGPLAAPVEVTVPSGGHVAVTFRGVALTTAAANELRVLVTDTAPGEGDATNDDLSTTVEVTKNELVPDRL